MTPTPHISAKKGEIASTVLLFGDPVRCKRSAEKFLKNYKEVSSLRGAHFFTGEYNGKKITFGTSGMGHGSMGIYSYELYVFYDVEVIIRVGTSGGYASHISNGDGVLVTESIGDDVTFAEVNAGEPWKIVYPDGEINERIRKSAVEKGVKLHEGRVHSTLTFYYFRNHPDIVRDSGAICVEMESYALFINAKRTNKKAACVLLIVNDGTSKKGLTSDERVVACDTLTEVVLNAQ